MVASVVPASERGAHRSTLTLQHLVKSVYSAEPAACYWSTSLHILVVEDVRLLAPVAYARQVSLDPAVEAPHFPGRITSRGNTNDPLVPLAVTRTCRTTHNGRPHSMENILRMRSRKPMQSASQRCSATHASCTTNTVTLYAHHPSRIMATAPALRRGQPAS